MPQRLLRARVEEERRSGPSERRVPARQRALQVRLRRERTWPTTSTSLDYLFIFCIFIHLRLFDVLQILRRELEDHMKDNVAPHLEQLHATVEVRLAFPDRQGLVVG